MIFQQQRQTIGSIRCSLNGIHDIMKYCKTEQLTNEIYVQKQSFKDKPTFQNKNYNYRVNVKREDTLRKEGVVRDLIRQVQTLRKDANFAVEDRIKIYTVLDGIVQDSLIEFKGLFMSEVLALEIIESPKGGEFSGFVKLEGQSFTFGLERVKSKGN